MKLQLPKGTRDFPPEDKIVRDKIVETLKNCFELYGFSPLETPAFERYDVLSSKYTGGSEILKETFKFKDQGKRDLALKYDLTVPMSRFIAMNPNTKMPFKRYQIENVWRDGPTATGRYRQFLQCDVDIVGCKSMLADAETISVIDLVFKKLGMDVTIKVNNRKLLNDILTYSGVKDFDPVILTIDKLEKFGEKTVKDELKQKGIKEDAIKKILNIITIRGTNKEKIDKLNFLKDSEGLKEINELLNYLEILNIEVDFDISLARGLSYYTGPVYEVILKKSSIKTSVCGGGRYDNMIGALIGTKKEYYATGCSFGVDRIYDAYTEKNKSTKKTNTKVFIIPIKTINKSLKIAKKLRDNNIKVDIDLLDRGPSKNLQYANSLRIPFVIFIGEEELKKNKLKLKDMNSGKEETLSVEDIIKKAFLI